MALSSDLAQFANGASGIYRLEFNKSQTASVPAEQIRLVVGYSNKGPFQTPVFVPDTGFFQEVFGQIDRSLERKGSYFHRTALAALERGPILALNLLRLNDDLDSLSPDVVEYKSMSTSVADVNNASRDALFSGFYNKDRFWFPSTEAFLENIELNKQLIQFTNLNQRPVTILVRHARDVRGFNITTKEWYGVGNVPEFLNENDYIKDFMVDVIILEGDWTNYNKLAIDPSFGKYFDSNKGLIKSELQRFLQDSKVNVLSVYTGSLIPDFIDLEGNNLFIENIVNFDTALHGVFCAVDRDLFDMDIISGTKEGIDLIGHTVEGLVSSDPDYNRIKFLSYDRPIKDDLEYPTFETPEIGLAVNTSEDISFSLASDPNTFSQTPPVLSTSDIINVGSGDVNYIIRIGAQGHSQYETDVEGNIFTNEPGNINRNVGSYVLMTNSLEFKWVPVTSLTFVSGVLNIGLSVEETGYEIYLDNGEMFFISAPNWMNHDSINGEFYGAKFNGMYDDFDSGIITTSDKAHSASEPAPWFLRLTNYFYGQVPGEGFVTDNASNVGNGSPIMGLNYSVPIVKVQAFEEDNFQTQVSLPAPVPNSYLQSDGTTLSDNFLIKSLAGKLNFTINIDVAASANLPINEVYISSDDYTGKISVGDYLVSDDSGPNGESRLTKVNRIVNEGALLRVITDAPMRQRTISGNVTIERYKEIESIIEHYKLFELKGFELNPLYHMPNATQDRINEIYTDTLSPDSNLFKALIDKENITFRYIIDTFGLGIQPESKFQLARLARARQNATAILNAPSIEDFKKSRNPRFTDITGALSTRLISEGGDLNLNPDFVYSLPSVDNGGSYSAFFSPYITVRDRGKNINIPPAGLVSNNYVDKYTNALPWSIVAGPRRGVITGTGVVGLEMNYNKEDRDNLEPFGFNPIIFQRGVGLMISGNRTAHQTPRSALSSVHVREVLIFIQDGIAEILKNYQWEFNTPQTRLEITTLADNFLRGIQQDQGIFDFKNVMDSSNNTNEVIDANIGVLDTFVEPVRGLEILVHRTTVLKTGSIATGQFR